MKTQEMTEVRASVGFPSLTPPNSKYIPKQCLFRNPSITLKGRWSEESIRRYCVSQAKKQGYSHVTLDIEYSYLDGEGNTLTVNLD